MAQEARPIDASSMPEVSRLVREVARTGQPRRILADGAEAVLSPARGKRRAAKQPKSEAVEAALALAGAWKGRIDPEKFRRDRQELQIDDKPVRAL